jgi:hypothetical protein
VFSGTPSDGHGHHQVSGILAREAYDLAGDTARMPLRAGERPWAPSKFYRTRSYWRGEGATFSYNAGDYSPLLGRSYAEIAGESRSQHKSQGFGVLQRKGYIPGSVRREATRVNAGTAADRERSIFEGVDTTWTRLTSDLTGADRARVDSIMAAVADARRVVNLARPASVLPALERLDGLVSRLAPRTPSPDVATSLASLDAKVDDAIALALGVAVEANVPRDVVALGDTVPVAVSVYNRGSRPVTIARVRVNGGDVAERVAEPVRIVAADSAFVDTLRVVGTHVSQPWWLAAPRRGDIFGVPVTGVREGRTSGTTAQVTLTSDGMRFAVSEPVFYRFADAVRGEVSRPLAVEPPVSVTMDRTVMLAPAGGALDRTIEVRVRSAVPDEQAVRVSLELPRGLVTDSASRTVRLAGVGATRALDFHVKGTLAPGRYAIAAVAERGGTRYSSGFVPIEYAHIRPQKLYRDATLTVEAVDVRLPRNANVAYIQGVGDNVARSLEELGLPVTILDPAKLATTDLSPYTAVVIGTRAYEAQPELVANNARLLDWARNGGTMVVQYGQYEMLQRGIMPYPITLDRPAKRVTVEGVPVTVLRPDHPQLTTPNEIGASDWQGWVQERALYMPTTHDSAYAAPLAMNDPGESPNDGALLVAPLGKGMYVYTTLSFFRQLPAGNPGAARLFANLLAAHPEGMAANGVRP